MPVAEESFMDRLVKDRKKRLHANSIASANGDRSSESSKAVTPEDLKSVTPHPDDERLYPREFRKWRFKFDENNSDGGWIAYHSLNERQRLLTESKLGSPIQIVLWSRWPRAVVDNFTPSDESEEPIV
jgi:hypothetical protein